MTEATNSATASPAPLAVRWLRPMLGAAIALSGLFWAGDVYRMAGIIFLPEQLLAIVFGLSLALVFLHFPARRGTQRGPLPWYDATAAAVGFAAAVYMAIRYPDLVETQFDMPTDGIVVSAIFYLLSIEGLRRTTGYALVTIVVAFTAYAMVGHLVPGSLQARETELDRLILYLGVDTSGLFGIVMLVGVTVVLPFLLFGQLLLYSGGASFFNDLSLALMGRYRGGAAKIAVMASSMFGSISGIVVSNILATGIITIPLMKRAGFKPHQAAAIEATASNGGQLMPPVMGAVAFLMADFLQRPYADIVVAALVPSLLYYVALFIQADLEAAKLGIRRVEEEKIPQLWGVLKGGWLFVAPFAVLVYALFELNLEPEVAALYASGTTLVVGLIGYRGERIKLRQLWDSLVQTGQGALEIMMIAAAAGFVMGILQTTGLGFALTLLLVEIGGSNLVVLLIIAALMCIVLGMGMPTIGVYVLLAVLIAPSLIEVGFTPLASHMFILYLGMMSMVTPPVAIAAFFAASLAGSEPMRTGFTAMRFGWTAYIVPFLFIFSPTLLLQDPSIINTAIAIVTAVVGVWLVSAGMIGFLFRNLPIPSRVGLVVGGLCLIIPDQIGTWAAWTNVAGVVIGGAFLAYERTAARRGHLAAPAAAERAQHPGAIPTRRP
ncbi:MAG TPA: TRAP transporter fused permease subunit [Alphaproteobacteria bacterium]